MCFGLIGYKFSKTNIQSYERGKTQRKKSPSPRENDIDQTKKLFLFAQPALTLVMKDLS